METLAELIRLITSSDNVEIDCDDIECTCSKTKYRIIKRIFITKGGEVYGIAEVFRPSFPLIDSLEI